jgi:hypothetical protein
MRLRLRATERGYLGAIELNGKQYTDLAEVHQTVIRILGDDRGPNSLQTRAELNMQCDDGLRIKYMLDAHDAVSGFTAEDGSRVMLIQTVRPMPGGSSSGLGEMEMAIPE